MKHTLKPIVLGLISNPMLGVVLISTVLLIGLVYREVELPAVLVSKTFTSTLLVLGFLVFVGWFIRTTKEN